MHHTFYNAAMHESEMLVALWSRTYGTQAHRLHQKQTTNRLTPFLFSWYNVRNVTIATVTQRTKGRNKVNHELNITPITPIPDEQPELLIEYTCTVCGAPCEEETTPGFLSRYCETCRVEVARNSNKERQKRWRETHKADPAVKEAARQRQAEYRKAHAAEVRAKDAQRKRAARAAKKSGPNS